MPLNLTLACYDYDWTDPLWSGRVDPEGVDLTTVDYPNPQRFTRMADHLEFDACELSMGTYLASRRDPDRYPFTAIPVFPYRKFRHSYIYVHRDSAVDSPTDLNGGRVGLANWQTTTGIWQRGILAERHGLDLDSIHWVVSGAEIAPLDPPYDVEYLDSRHGSMLPLLEDELEDGNLDALFVPVVSERETTRRLFEDPLAAERAYAQHTGIFPIMHTVVVRDDLLEAEPWVAQNLFDAFDRAKAMAMETVAQPRHLPFAWSRLYAEDQRSVLGDDPWEYGLTDQNRTTLETLVDYAYRQGVAAERYALEDLFATEHLNTRWFGTH